MMRLIFYKSVASCFAFEVGALRNAKKLLARVKRFSEVLNKKKYFCSVFLNYLAVFLMIISIFALCCIVLVTSVLS